MFYDLHSHIDIMDISVVEESIEKKVKIVAVATNIESVEKLLEIKKRYVDDIYLFLGLHPEYRKSDSDIERVIEIVEENIDLVDGIGEVGIPYFNIENLDISEKEVVRKKGVEVLERFVKYGASKNLPINLHIVGDDIEVALFILDRYGVERALFHWYIGSSDNLDQIRKRGYYISVNVDLINDEKYREYVKDIPLDMIVMESDSPYSYVNKENRPSDIEKGLEVLSRIKDIEYNRLVEVVSKNSRDYLKKL